MNTHARWEEQKVDDTTVRYISEHTVGGPVVVTARLVDGSIEWDRPNDVPVLLVERAAATLGA